MRFQVSDTLGQSHKVDVSARVSGKLKRVSPAPIIHYAAQRHEPQKDSKRDDGALARQVVYEPRQPVSKRADRRPSENQNEQPDSNVEPEGGRHASQEPQPGQASHYGDQPRRKLPLSDQSPHRAIDKGGADRTSPLDRLLID